MSRHENVSCDSCTKSNFKGRRYKCLICYDYDLCATCYEAGTCTNRHTADHAMQCILTRSDFDVFYDGEGLGPDNPQSYTCPHCAVRGYTEDALYLHMQSKHGSSRSEVICPICASLTGGNPNFVTSDLLTHIQMEHRMSHEPFEPPEPTSLLRNPRRHPGYRARGGRGTRHWAPSGNSSSSGNGSSPHLRESMDPIAELLSHLSGAHNRLNMRAAPQLREIQLLTGSSGRPNIPERLLREQLTTLARAPHRASVIEVRSGGTEEIRSSNQASSSRSSTNSSNTSLLSRFMEHPQPSGQQLENIEERGATNCLFTQELLLSTLMTRQPYTADSSQASQRDNSLGSNTGDTP